jgi:hypothetical protein
MSSRGRSRMQRSFAMVCRGWWLSALTFISAVSLGGQARANGLRCENRWIGIGDSLYEVRSLCGTPDAVAQRVEHRTLKRVVAVPCPRGPARCTVVVQDTIEVAIDEWTYDFGPQRFVQYLLFESGKLVAVESGGYGHDLE